jgi:hypothetical protein
VVAGERKPSNVPVMLSCFPESVAVIEPDPATVDIIVTSIGTGDNRALNVSPADVFCAEAVRPADADIKHKLAAHKSTVMILRRIAIVFSNARTLFMETSISILRRSYAGCVVTSSVYLREGILKELRNQTIASRV